MVERRPALTLLSHLVLVLGVLVVAFPVYVTFIASTQTSEQIVNTVPMSLAPMNSTVSIRTACIGSL